MKWLPVLLLIALSSAAAAQPASQAPVSVSALLSGQVAPLTMTLGSLDGRWCRFTTGAAGGTDIYSAMYGIEPTPYYTKGQTVRAGDQIYLLAYKAQIRPAGLWMIMAGRGGLGDVPTVTEETTLGLCLLNLATTGSFLDISVFDLESEIDRYAQAAERLQAAVDQMGVGYEEEVVEDNLDQIAIALEMYTIDHGDVLPPMTTQAEWEEALSWYVADSSVFVDPATEEPYPINASLSGVELASMETPAMIVAVYEAQLRDDGTRKVVFADGSTGYIAEDAWAGMGGMKSASGIR
jgi:hypothetical protein